MVVTTKMNKPLRQFRQEVYQMFAPSRDAAFEIIDAIASSPDARSAVEISLSPTMKRKFHSVYKGIERTRVDEENLRSLLVRQAEASGELTFDGYAIYALDHSPYPRRAAHTVSDRGYVHGADGRVIGHRYSLLGRVMHSSGSWVGVVDCERIATHQSPGQVGAVQIERLKAKAKLPQIITADSEYPIAGILDCADERTRLLIRLRGSNTLYAEPEPRPAAKRGASAKHGSKLKLNRPETLKFPTYQTSVEEANGGRTLISVWERVHFKSRPGHALSIVRVECFKADGRPCFETPLWLVWTGPAKMDWATLWKVYLKRFRVECVHQFTKNSLAWTRGRFGYTDREERWTWLVLLAYWQLLLAAALVREVYRPWEKPAPKGKLPTPSRVQRAYLKIYSEIGSPALPPIKRGIPPGRVSGYRPPPRSRYKVVYKRRGSAVTTL